MAEILGAVAAASQLGSQVIFLFRALRNVKYSSVSLRAFHCKLEELRLISICIQKNPLLHTEDIGRHTTHILGLLRTNPVASTLAKKGLRRVLAILFDQKAFDALFRDLEERKSTLTLCITNIHAYALYDIKAYLSSHAMGTPCPKSTPTAAWHRGPPPRPGVDTALEPSAGPQQGAATLPHVPPTRDHAAEDAQGAGEECTGTPSESPATFLHNIQAGDGRFVVGVHKTRNRPEGRPLAKVMANAEFRDCTKMEKRDALLSRSFVAGILRSKANWAGPPPGFSPDVVPIPGDGHAGGEGRRPDGNHRNRGNEKGEAMVVGALFDDEADLEAIAGKFVCNVNMTDGDMVTGFKC